MSLGLDDNSLLIIENLKLKWNSVPFEYVRASKYDLLDSKETQNRNKESRDLKELNETNFIFEKTKQNTIKRERRKFSK